MLRPALTTLLLLLSLSGRAADEIEPLEHAFLDYLANLATDGDDWTLLAEDPTPPPSTVKPEKPPKQAASKPAVDER